MHVRATAATAALLALLANGCARADADTAGPVATPGRSGPSTPTVHDRWESCDKAAPASADGVFGDSQDALTLPLPADGFQPVTAVICRTGFRERPGGGTEMTAEEARWTAIRAEIEASPPAVTTCSTPAGSFAVLHLTPGGTIHVEADGCRRVLVEPALGSSVYRQSSARLASLLFP